MAKSDYTLTPVSVPHVNPLSFSLDAAGQVVALRCHAEVNYGSRSLDYDIDLWPTMTPSQRAAAQAMSTWLRARIDQLILG